MLEADTSRDAERAWITLRLVGLRPKSLATPAATVVACGSSTPVARKGHELVLGFDDVSMPPDDVMEELVGAVQPKGAVALFVSSASALALREVFQRLEGDRAAEVLARDDAYARGLLAASRSCVPASGDESPYATPVDPSRLDALAEAAGRRGFRVIEPDLAPYFPALTRLVRTPASATERVVAATEWFGQVRRPVLFVERGETKSAVVRARPERLGDVWVESARETLVVSAEDEAPRSWHAVARELVRTRAPETLSNLLRHARELRGTVDASDAVGFGEAIVVLWVSGCVDLRTTRPTSRPAHPDEA